MPPKLQPRTRTASRERSLLSLESARPSSHRTTGPERPASICEAIQGWLDSQP